MEETLLYNVCHCCSDVVVEGGANLTLEQAEAFISQYSEVVENTECGDTQKYIVLPAIPA